jgi:hypothetical protein
MKSNGVELGLAAFHQIYCICRLLQWVNVEQSVVVCSDTGIVAISMQEDYCLKKVLTVPRKKSAPFSSCLVTTKALLHKP